MNNPMLIADFYKVSHREQYPIGTQKVYSTWTPRMSRIEGCTEVITFGIQAMCIELLKEYFDINFFNKDIDTIVNDYKRTLTFALGIKEPHTKHIEDLHKLGYLPVKVMAVPEGTKVPLRCPMMTIENTDDRFFWLTNYLETIMSNYLWKPMTSATIAYEYKKILDSFAMMTVGNVDAVKFQGHDFSMRGMAGLESAITSGAGHLTSFVGTDTIPAIPWLEKNYMANIETELVGCSIPATEHSVMSCGGFLNEFDTYKRLITKIYPSGLVAIVSDTWDLWHVITDTLVKLKDDILSRNGKVVIRPDSGNPADIICGLNTSAVPSDNRLINEQKGVIELLWDVFGGTINSKGYKELNPHIGAIYGDAITLERATEICRRLESKGFASTNIVLGIGSYTYNCNTRDTFGFALKSTYAIINGEEKMIFKNPITDKDNFKKSQTGKVVVMKKWNDEIIYIDNLLQENFDEYGHSNIMQTAFENGIINRQYLSTLAEIRSRIQNKAVLCKNH